MGSYPLFWGLYFVLALNQTKAKRDSDVDPVPQCRVPSQSCEPWAEFLPERVHFVDRPLDQFLLFHGAEPLDWSCHDLHAFGVKGSVLQFADVRRALASADSHRYEMQAHWATLHELGAGRKTWRDSAFEYLKR